MLKKVLSVMMCFSLIFSISALTTINVSAAAHPNFEIVQDFENSTDANVQSGSVAIDGDKSLVVDGNAAAAGGVTLGDLPAPTIANPTGVFFRVEVSKPFTGGGFLMNGSTWTDFSTYDGKTVVHSIEANEWVGYTASVFTSSRLQGIFYVPLNNLSSGVKGLAISNMSNCGWATSNATLIIDDVGYYSVPDPTNPDFTTVAPLIQSDFPVNPELISSISTGTYNSSVLVTTPLQMKSIIYHASSQYSWSVDDTNVASIDANGLLTPKKTGVVNVTYANTTKSSVTMTDKVNVVFGYITITCGDNGNTDQAVYGIKLRLRGAPSFTMPDTNFKWSVVSGPATIKDTDIDLKGLDSDLVNVPDVAASMVTFTDSGTVVVRASYVIDPAVYSDYTFHVSPNLSYLAQSIIAAQGYTSQGYTTASYKALKTALASSVTLYNGGAAATTQTALTASKKALDDAIANLVLVSSATTSTKGTTNTATDTDSTGANPHTGTSNDIFPALMIAMVSLGGIIVTVRKTILNK